MTRILLIHSGNIEHYRIPIYEYLYHYLKTFNIELYVTSNGIQVDNIYPYHFHFINMQLSTYSIIHLIKRLNIDAVIIFAGLNNIYIFPLLIFLKVLLKTKTIYWGHGRDLGDPFNPIKNIAYAAEQLMCSSIILYAEHLKRWIPSRFHRKTFIANNTLCINYAGMPSGITRKHILQRYNIQTNKNIVCLGRMQRRKRIDVLVKAFQSLNRPDIGLILAGPDPEGVLEGIRDDRIYKIGSIYDDDKYNLLSSSDVYCLPGAIGLSIVDAFYCGLPMVTEDGDESAEIMYLKSGINGFVVPRGDLSSLKEKLLLLLDDIELRVKFSHNARKEIIENGNMETFCFGFQQALNYAFRRSLVLK